MNIRVKFMPSFNIATTIRVAITLLLISFIVTSCSKNQNAKEIPLSAASQKTKKKNKGVISFHAQGKTIRVDVEIVKTEADRAYGLMHRKSLADRQGMLFMFEKEEIQSFWMKNTYISLDMIFIDSTWKIAGILEYVEPMTTQTRQVKKPSLYVVEVNAGFSKKHGLRIGDSVSFNPNSQSASPYRAAQLN